MTVILLAAGLSARMGTNKLLLPFRGQPLLLSAYSAALAASDRVIVVTGHDREKVEMLLPPEAETVFAPDYAEGQKYSTLRGVEAVEDDDFAILPGDLPLITEEDIRGTSLLLAHQTVARAFHGGIPGHPVAYRKENRERLLAFAGTMKEYLSLYDAGRYEGSIGCIADADTPERYRALCDGDLAIFHREMDEGAIFQIS